MVSDFKLTFLKGTYLPVWQVILFCNHWLQKVWDHKTIIECLKRSKHTSVDVELLFSSHVGLAKQPAAYRW